jgi:ABC-2 type transport system ATP-binding protein
MSHDLVVLEDVCRFYGEVLGVNHINLSIGPGITSLVGPNGSGKTTLLRLIDGLIRPSKGRISVLGYRPDQPQQLMRILGYATQFDSFPMGLTGLGLIYSLLRMSGYPHSDCRKMANQALEQVGLVQDSHRRIGAYSKGMKQRLKLACAIAHQPQVLLLDEPLNGLDPLIRATIIQMLRRLGREGRHVIISSHVLNEVEMISDQVVLLSGGYVAAEGPIHTVRTEIKDQPMEFLIQCDKPRLLACSIFQHDHVVEARLLPEDQGLLVKTRDANQFCRTICRLALGQVQIHGIIPTDDNVRSIYEYLVGNQEASK